MVKLTKDLSESLADRHVLFIEDIIDSGFTTHFIMRTISLHDPASLNICILLNRPRRRIIDIDPAYVGFEIPDYYVVGYGLDYNEDYRELPELYHLKT